MNENPKKPPTIQIYRILWASLFASQLMYVFMLFNVLAPKTEDSEPYRWFPNFNNPIELGVSIAAVVCIFASFSIPAVVARKVGSTRPPIDADPGTETNSRLNRLLPAFIIRLAFSEAACILGLLAGMRAKNAGVIGPFFAVSAILFFRVFPANASKVSMDLGV